MTDAIPYRYIAVEGNIGAGKTTFCHLLQRAYDCGGVLETFEDNPFLPLFYQDARRAALSVELFFLMVRKRQLKDYFSHSASLYKFTVSDYLFDKTLVFAKNNLSKLEFDLFYEIFQAVKEDLPKPDICIYLHRNMENLLGNIKRRGRDLEKNIAADYLHYIESAYFHYFQQETSMPVLIVNVDNLEFSEPERFHQIVNLLKRKYTAGVHHIDLSASMNAVPSINSSNL